MKGVLCIGVTVRDYTLERVGQIFKSEFNEVLVYNPNVCGQTVLLVEATTIAHF